jgi:CRISPR-associated endonuclease Csn1
MTATYRYFVKRKKVEELSKGKLADIRNKGVHEIVTAWVDKRGGDPKKAFPPYPRRGRKGPEIRKVRLWEKKQARLMAQVGTGYVELGNNHHMAIYWLPNGNVDYEVVSLLEASRRLLSREPVVRRERGDGSRFLMSLSPGDVVEFQQGEKQGLWAVREISSEGRPTLACINDARPTKDARFRPSIRSFVKRQPKKLSVDPIGHVRPAND